MFIYSHEFCYFWDTIQQVSKEANWFYQTNFSSLLIHPLPGLEVTPTGYHPPLIPLTTAFLWKIFGYELWVSHAFTFLWSLLLLYHSWKMVAYFIPYPQWTGWVFGILLLEPTILTQLVMASPDMVLLTASIIGLRAVFQRKPVWLAISLIFLCGTNMRGVFTGVMLFFSHLYFDVKVTNKEQGYNLKKLLKLLLPYLPVCVLLLAYFLYYFSHNAWFFSEEGASNYSEHYSLPENGMMIVRHFAELVFRFVENGRFVVSFLALYVLIGILKRKWNLSEEEKTLGLFFLLMIGLFLFFVFITRMPFNPRYFMLHFFILSLLTLRLLINQWNNRKMKTICWVILLFTLTGHFWIYPEKISQPWESTLLHTSYYTVRKECFEYIDSNQIEYSELAANWCLYGNRGFVELKNGGKIVGTSAEHAKYFLYSNIAVSDEEVEEFKNKDLWIPVKHFEKTPVFITLYKRNENP
ncbi:MAG: glycosyltransferase family 39 protein [Tannerellaceae bacterium]|nr:glycosyltransferase family 39 protein [Tannerellaceae bacterium]